MPKNDLNNTLNISKKRKLLSTNRELLVNLTRSQEIEDMLKKNDLNNTLNTSKKDYLNTSKSNVEIKEPKRLATNKVQNSNRKVDEISNMDCDIPKLTPMLSQKSDSFNDANMDTKYTNSPIEKTNSNRKSAVNTIYIIITLNVNYFLFR